jgi:quercetin dioxygenase-like cupin family protein
MTYDVVNYEDVEPKAPGMYFLRDALDCHELGITVIEADEGWEGMEHAHDEDGQEEVYVLLDGSAKLSIEGDTVPLDPGDAVRVDPEDSRMLVFYEGDSQMVVAGAP